MTAAFLQTELTSLISDSKRKQSDVRVAAEKSLADLKTISVTSETQLAGDLVRKLQFIDPFILACNSKHAKLAVTGTICLQRLVASRAIPRGRLADVLDAFQEASHQGLDVQLKILQALPSLLQLYSNELHGEPLAKILSLCAGLSSSKTGMVSSTASATLQQLITSVFERKSNQSPKENASGDGIAEHDASRVFIDMCSVVKSEQTQYLKLPGFSLHLGLEVVENSLARDELEILDLPQCETTCESLLIPGLVDHLEKTNNFTTFVRCLRVSFLLLTKHQEFLQKGMDNLFHIILSWLDRGVGASWKRALCLEFIQNIYSDFELFRTIYTAFDQTPNQRRVVQDLMAILVRIAAEDPSLIGLGRQSTIPADSSAEDANDISGTLDVQGLDSVGSVMQANSNITGISTKWSTIDNALMEQIERSAPSEIPATYIYTLVLACVAAFSDGLSKFLMPLSVPTRPESRTSTTNGGESTDGPERSNSQRTQKYQRLLNPLKRPDLPEIKDVEVCAKMVENCWPAVLATCSTFLNSALDSTYYHILVRTVQKLAQVSGILELETPRDALLTTLAKVSVPLNASSLVSVLHGDKLAKKYEAEDLDDGDVTIVTSPVPNTPRLSVDTSRSSLNVRNLLCLRALLNLGIALGPTLGSVSWIIIIQAIQQVDALMSASPSAKSFKNNTASKSNDNESQSNLASEITAVGTATRRMIESTRTFSDSNLETLVLSIFSMVEDLTPAHDGIDYPDDMGHKRPPIVARVSSAHRRNRSVSAKHPSGTILKVEVEFVLKTIGDIARINLYRFASLGSISCSWNLITPQLLRIVGGGDIDPGLRLQAASTVDVIVMETVKLLEKQNFDGAQLDALQQACLSALHRQVELIQRTMPSSTHAPGVEIEIYRRLLDALENVVSNSGDSLTNGWKLVFKMLQLSVVPSSSDTNTAPHETHPEAYGEAMMRTLAPAFRTVQLIISDFLSSIDPDSLWVLVRLLPLFGLQKLDLNIALTTTTLFWNINSLILERTSTLNVTHRMSEARKIHDKSHPSDAADTSALWFEALTYLVEVCGDSRTEVRNGAIHVLMRILSTSGDHLSSDMWNLSLDKLLLPLLQRYCDMKGAQSEWQTSFEQLLDGLVTLITNNAATVVDTDTFPQTWVHLIGVMSTMLEKGTPTGHSSVFETLSKLLQSMKVVKPEDNRIVLPVLEVWYKYHPIRIENQNTSTIEAFSSHAYLLTSIEGYHHASLSGYTLGGNDIGAIMMKAIKQTAFSVEQEKYSDDAKRMSKPQEAVIENLMILKAIMSNKKRAYHLFILDLIAGAMVRNKSQATSEKIELKNTTNFKQSTLIAFTHKCIEILRSDIPTATISDDWPVDIAAPDTLRTLADVVRTKYTPIPINKTAPLWQIATTVAVEIVEALQRNKRTISSVETVKVVGATAEVAEAILNAPALETLNSKELTEQMIEDENFDVQNFSRLHKALMTMGDHRYEDHNAEIEYKRYIVMVFTASLIAKPWLGDLPSDLIHKPLSDFRNNRPGSIRTPVFYPRTGTSYEALEALFELVARKSASSSSVDEESINSINHPQDSHNIATLAAPYLILRTALTVKSFLADQKLRELNPPPRPILKELNIILNKSLELCSQDQAFESILGKSSSSSSKFRHNDGDGIAHLRILYPLILQLNDLWTKLPRLKVCAWQDTEDGMAIEYSLRRWGDVIAQGWDVNP